MSYFKVAANGAAAIVSRTVTVAEKSIDYEEVIRVIKEQEKEEEKERNPPPMPTPAAIPTPAAMAAPIDNTRIPPIPNKRHAGDGQYPSEVIQDHHIYRNRMAITLAKLKEQIKRDCQFKDNMINRY
ncbi:hypothetical protein WR25_12775 [Diploscapter pachys]|uniref:Uncharacterized protein n=1 Tax=Diploscapter pachys TaxID=2018661 RepID=A0A2A2KTG4_9BILA|nr:hypothetical protein WR25_12775 [Diploscapter pachys]